MRIFCKYAGVKGFVKLYNDALKYAYMIIDKALHKACVLALWEKHGLEAAALVFADGGYNTPNFRAFAGKYGKYPVCVALDRHFLKTGTSFWIS